MVSLGGRAGRARNALEKVHVGDRELTGGGPAVAPSRDPVKVAAEQVLKLVVIDALPLGDDR